MILKCVKITPSMLYGKIVIPPSKSLSHRAIIAAGLSHGSSQIDNIIFSQDIMATCNGMESFAINIEERRNGLNIRGNPSLHLIKNEIHCSESGSTLRFLIPLALIAGEKITFYGKGKLQDRPIQPYINIFQEQGIYYQYDNKLPLTVEGKLQSGNFSVKGDISSQFITGLLFALPLLEGDSTITVTTELESKGYVDLTIDILNKFGIQIKNDDYRKFYVPGNQTYHATHYRVEGDFSQAAFWLAAGILGGNIACYDLYSDSLQGDKVIIDFIEKMQGNLIKDTNAFIVQTSQTKGLTIDVSQCPDLVPILAVLGALSEGKTEIVNAGRLRIKESDRLKAIATELNKLGANIQEKEDRLIIYGTPHLKGGQVDSWNDHRIAMALAVASIRCTEPLCISNSDAVKKSYPTFFEDFKQLGGKVDEWYMG